MSLTVNVHGFAKFDAHAWSFGASSAVEMRLIQENGDSIGFTIFVRDGDPAARAIAIAAALNGAGKPASAYDPELDGIEEPAAIDAVRAAMAEG